MKWGYDNRAPEEICGSVYQRLIDTNLRINQALTDGREIFRIK
jgi:hypothetical protein